MLLSNSIRRNLPRLFLGMVAALILATGPTPACRAAEDAQETLFIPLRSNPSTGYMWSWTATGDGAVRETGIDYEQENEMPGSPATFTYNFVGEREGEVRLRFVYSQSEPPNPGSPVNEYDLSVLPDKRIMLLDMREDIVGKPQPQW